MTLRPLLIAALAVLSANGLDSYTSCKQKFDLIQNEKLRAGARIELSATEISAYATHEAPPGVRDLRLVLAAGGGTGSAIVDFGKLRRAQGYQPGWLMSKLLDGERPVSVSVRIRSANGQATVDVDRISISGIEIDGRTLEFLIQNFLLVLYPNALVGRPFELAHHMERLDVRSFGVGVVIGK